MMPYERLDCWRACDALADAVYRVTRAWPAVERYGLTSQLRRAALSAPTNIAEGSMRRGPRELARYLEIAFASLGETRYLIDFARGQDILDDAGHAELANLHQHAARLTWSLLKAVRAPSA